MEIETSMRRLLDGLIQASFSLAAFPTQIDNCLRRTDAGQQQFPHGVGILHRVQFELHCVQALYNAMDCLAKIVVEGGTVRVYCKEYAIHSNALQARLPATVGPCSAPLCWTATPDGNRRAW